MISHEADQLTVHRVGSERSSEETTRSTLESSVFSRVNTWRIIPFSKWLVTTIYKPFRPFGRWTTRSLGDLRSQWLLTTLQVMGRSPKQCQHLEKQHHLKGIKHRLCLKEKLKKWCQNYPQLLCLKQGRRSAIWEFLVQNPTLTFHSKVGYQIISGQMVHNISPT